MRVHPKCHKTAIFKDALLGPLDKEFLTDRPEVESLLLHELSMMPHHKKPLVAWIREQLGYLEPGVEPEWLLNGLATFSLKVRLESSLNYPLRDLTCDRDLLAYRESLRKLDDGQRSARSIVQAAPEFPNFSGVDSISNAPKLKIIMKASWEKGFGNSEIEHAELLAVEEYNKQHINDPICIVVEGLIASDLLPWMGGSSLNSTGLAPNVPVFYALRMPSGESALIPLTVAKPPIEGRINNVLPMLQNQQIFHGLKPSRILGDEPFIRDRNPYAGLEGVDHRAQLLEDIWESLATARARYAESEIAISRLPEDCTRGEIEEVIEKCIAALLESKIVASPERLLDIPREEIASDILERLKYIGERRPTYSAEQYAERKARGYPMKMPLDGISLPLHHVAIDSIRTFEKGIKRAYDEPERFIRTGVKLEEVTSEIKNARYIEIAIQDPEAPDDTLVYKIMEEGSDKNFKNRVRRIVQTQINENIRRLERLLGLDKAAQGTSGATLSAYAARLKENEPPQPQVGIILGPHKEFDRWKAHHSSIKVISELQQNDAEFAENKAEWQRDKETALFALLESVPKNEYKEKKRAIDEKFGGKWETLQMSYLEKRCELLMELAYLQSDSYSVSTTGTREKEQFCDSFLQRIIRIIDTEQFKLIYVINDREELVMAEEALRPLLGIATPRPSHSELAEGGNVFGAGEILFERYCFTCDSYSRWLDSYYGFDNFRNEMWKIVEINNGSGHYRPPVETLPYVESVIREFMSNHNRQLRAKGTFSLEVMVTQGAIRKTDSLARGRNVGDLLAVY